jgi:hypothetical protein
MVDIAHQYPDPTYGWLRSTAVSALGEISALSDGLRCADLAALGRFAPGPARHAEATGAPFVVVAQSDVVPDASVLRKVRTVHNLIVSRRHHGRLGDDGGIRGVVGMAAAVGSAGGRRCCRPGHGDPHG